MHLLASSVCTSSDSVYPSTVVMANLMTYHDAVISEHCSALHTLNYGGPEGQSSGSSLNRCSQSSGSSLNRSSQSSGSSLNRSSRSVLVAECFICPFNFNHKALVYDVIYIYTNYNDSITP